MVDRGLHAPPGKAYDGHVPLGALTMKLGSAALVFVALFAGCVGDAETPASTPTVDLPKAIVALGGQLAPPLTAREDAGAASKGGTPSEVSATFAVVPQVNSTDVGSWYVAAIDVPAGHAGLGGFRWTVPVGAVHEAQHNSGHSSRGLSLEVAFLTPTGTDVHTFSAAWFLMKDEVPYPLAVQVAAPSQARTREVPVVSTPADAGYHAGPTFLSLGETVADEGYELGIVVAAEGNASAFGVAFRVVDRFVVPGLESPAADSSHFLAMATEQGPGVALAQRGSGLGYQVAGYIDSYDILDSERFEIKLGNVQVEERVPLLDARPVGSIRDVTISSAFEAPAAGRGGWGQAEAFLIAGPAAVTWTLAGDVHGLPVHDTGMAMPAQNPGSHVNGDYYGAEQPNGSLRLDVQLFGVNRQSMIGFFTHDYGTAISTLLSSKPPAKESGRDATRPGTIQLEGDDIVLYTGIEVRLLAAGRAP